MTEREALLALAAPEPEPFRQVIPTAADNARWQAWNDRRLNALKVADRAQRAYMYANAVKGTC